MTGILATWYGHSIRMDRPEPHQINLTDIARGLSNTCRYNGQVRGYYSVAEHSVLMCRYAIKSGAGRDIATLALMHDAQEAYVGDVIAPLKRLLGEAYAKVEASFWDAICTRFCYDWTEEELKIVKSLDNRIRLDELVLLGDAEKARAGLDFGGETVPLGVDIYMWSPQEAEARFREMFSVVSE